MFLKVVSVFVLFVLLQAQAATFRSKSSRLIQGRIVGGKSANRGQFPYHVQLVYTNLKAYTHSFCGATIISSRHILSAAHCIQMFKDDTTELFAIFNRAHLNDADFTAIQIAKAYDHPKYTNESFRFDIAILWTRHEIEFNDFIQPIQLPTIDYTKRSGDDAVIAGWGRLWVRTPVIFCKWKSASFEELISNIELKRAF